MVDIELIMIEAPKSDFSEDKIWEILLSEAVIRERVKALASEISEDYQDKKLLIIGILRGAFIFAADIIRELSEKLPDLEVDFIALSSYSDGEESSRAPRIEKDLNTNIEGWDVLIVEDIVDTGYSFDKLLKLLLSRNPSSLKTCVLLSKPGRREVDVDIDYLGFNIEDRWVEGYGLDTLQKGRGRRDIVAKRLSTSPDNSWSHFGRPVSDK